MADAGYLTLRIPVYDHLLTSGITELHPLLVQSLTGLAAAAMLETFPNTTTTA